MTTSDLILIEDPPGGPVAGHPRRWATLAVMCLAVFVTVLDGTIVNVALPTLAIELGATTRELQWIVDAYLLVFTGLLLAAGGLGDRFGRKRALMVGLVVFGLTSALAGSAGSASGLIVGRALMGIGAALIFPATLAVITNVFRDAGERAKAIGIWSAATGVAVAAGPITGGWLLEHFWWGSVFFINVPVVVVVVIVTWLVVPESREGHAARLDWIGAALSIAAIGALVFTIIEAPVLGWLDPRTIAGFTGSALVLIGFVAWERRVPDPMLPVSIFRNLRFSAASVAVTSAFFALFGFIFLITQYFQLVQGYRPLEAGVRTLPVALSIAIAAVVAPRVVQSLGTTQVVQGRPRPDDGSVPVDRIAGRRRHVIPRDRRPDGPARRRTRRNDRARYRVDHGLAVDRQGGHRVGRERHDPGARRHARRGDHRQRLQFPVRRVARQRRWRVRRAAARGASAGQGVRRRCRHRRP